MLLTFAFCWTQLFFKFSLNSIVMSWTFSVSDESIQGNFRSIEKSLKQVKGDLENCKKSSMEGDKFPEVMEISFVFFQNTLCKVLILHVFYLHVIFYTENFCWFLKRKTLVTKYQVWQCLSSNISRVDKLITISCL